MAEKYGGKWLFGIGTLATAILTLLTPAAAYAGTGAFIALRICEGLGEVKLQRNEKNQWTNAYF